MLHDYLALPEVQFFLKWWWAEFSLIALVCAPLLAMQIRKDRRAARR